MHCEPCLSSSPGSAEIAVLDTIHGAATLASEMVDRGLRATALEVYHENPEMSGYDLVVAPVHLWSGNPALEEARRLGKRVITHHRAVGELLGPPGMRVFELTGTRGKTTSALLLARILSQRGRILSHTTRGIEIWEDGNSRIISSGLSITPANMILALKEALAAGAGSLVGEVSLGGCGLADYGILTSLSGDYLVAQGSLWASTAKLQMVSLLRSGSLLISNMDAAISSNMTFGPGGDVSCDGSTLAFRERSAKLELGGGVDRSSYLQAIACAAAASIAAGLFVEEIAEALEGFEGFSGRMMVSSREGLSLVDNSNSGLQVSGISHALDYARGGSLALVAGEEAQTVCEGMDVPALVELLRSRRDEIDLLVLVGERLRPYAKELHAITASDLPSGLALAEERPGLDKLLSCVKCFR